MRNSTAKAILIFIPLLILGLHTTCSHGPIRPLDGEGSVAATLHLRRPKSNGPNTSEIATIRVTVEGTDTKVTVPLTTAQSGGTEAIEIDVDIPAGSGRTLLVEALSKDGEVVARGIANLDVSEVGTLPAVEVLLYRTIDRQAGIFATAIRKQVTAGNEFPHGLTFDFHAAPGSHPGKLHVGKTQVAQFFGANKFIWGLWNNNTLNSSFANDESGKYLLWFTFNGETSYVEIIFPDTVRVKNFRKGTAGKVDHSSVTQAFPTFVEEEDIVVTWDRVEGASSYYVGLRPKGLSSYLEERVVASNSVNFPGKSTGDYDIIIVPLFGPTPEKGAAGNLKGGLARGIVLGYNDIEYMADGTDYIHRNPIEIVPPPKLSAPKPKPKASIESSAGKSYSTHASLRKLFRTSTESEEPASRQQIHFVKAHLQKQKGATGDLRIELLSDPFRTSSPTITFQSRTPPQSVTLKEENLADHINWVYNQNVNVLAAVCTLIIDMGDGNIDTVIIQVPNNGSGSLSPVNPDAPTGAISAESDEVVKFDWDDVEGATGYIVRFKYTFPFGTSFFTLPDKIVYASEVELRASKELRFPGPLEITVIPFGGVNPNESLKEPNISYGTSGSPKILNIDGTNSLLSMAGYFWSTPYMPVGTFTEDVNRGGISDSPDLDKAKHPDKDGPFDNNFDNGLGAWTACGFWHHTVVGNPIPMPEEEMSSSSSGDSPYCCYRKQGRMWYGQEATGNYENGEANYGCLVSPWVTVTCCSKLKFCSWFQVENVSGLGGYSGDGSYDIRRVEVYVDGKWRRLYINQLSNVSNAGSWQEICHTLYELHTGDSYGPHSAKRVRFRFLFKTRDRLFNNYRGWYVDNVRIGNSCD